MGQHDSSHHDRSYSDGNHRFRISKTPGKHLVIKALQGIEEREVLSILLLPDYRLADKIELHEGYQQYGHQQGDGQNQRNGPGEAQQEVVHQSDGYHQKREEGDTDGQRSRQDGLEEMNRTVYRGMPARHSLRQAFQIAVYNHDRIVHNHSQGNNQGCQRNRIKFHPEGMKQSQRNKDGDGNSRSSH